MFMTFVQRNDFVCLRYCCSGVGIVGNISHLGSSMCAIGGKRLNIAHYFVPMLLHSVLRCWFFLKFASIFFPIWIVYASFHWLWIVVTAFHRFVYLLTRLHYTCARTSSYYNRAHWIIWFICVVLFLSPFFRWYYCCFRSLQFLFIIFFFVLFLSLCVFFSLRSFNCSAVVIIQCQ